MTPAGAWLFMLIWGVWLCCLLLGMFMVVFWGGVVVRVGTCKSVFVELMLSFCCLF